MNDQKLLFEVTLPEYAADPAIMKGPYWVASNLQLIVVAYLLLIGSTNATADTSSPENSKYAVMGGFESNGWDDL